ncbi:MAG: ABA4-like family protein [Candidatus Kapaibacteriota bacterium]|jgi:hypothetical protein
MTHDALFQAANVFAMLGWLFLAVLPRWKYTRRIVLSGNVLVLALAYALLFFTNFATINGGGGMSIANISTAFQNPVVMLVGWVHYLAFDLFIGAWEVQDAQANGISHWLVIPCLFATFMAGPVGLLLYTVLRMIRTKRLLD